jgi:hypothetical protein
MVGVRGFEPPTPSSRTRCATRLRYTPTHPDTPCTGEASIAERRTRRNPVLGGKSDAFGLRPRRVTLMVPASVDATDDRRDRFGA